MHLQKDTSRPSSHALGAAKFLSLTPLGRMGGPTIFTTLVVNAATVRSSGLSANLLQFVCGRDYFEGTDLCLTKLKFVTED